MNRILLATALAFALPTMLLAQLSIPNSTPVVIDFNDYLGLGFDATPAAGMLDSDNWASTGMSDGAMTYGSTQTAGDYAKGVSSGGVTGGGFYAFEVAAGDTALGAQLTGSDFTPGTLTLRVQNNTGATMTDLGVSYDLWVLNNATRSNTWNFSHSANDTTYTDEASLDFSSTEASDANGWVNTPMSISLSGLNIGNGAYYYIRWSSADAGGSGSRDEFAIDDVTLTAGGLSVACGPATNLGFTSIQDTSVIITWDTVAGAQSYKIVYKVAGTPGWSNVAFKHTNQGQLLIEGLTAGTKYRFGVWSNCGSGFENLANDGRFTTLASPCIAPDSTWTGPTATWKARLNWTAVPVANRYRIRWHEVGEVFWIYKIKDASKLRHWLTGLGAGSDYEWQVQTLCQPGSGVGSAWSALNTFTTAGSAKFADEAGVAPASDFEFTVFPNPSEGVLHMALPEGSNELFEVQIFNALGQQIYTQRLAAAQLHQLDISGSQPGIYLVRASNGAAVWHERVVLK